MVCLSTNPMHFRRDFSHSWIRRDHASNSSTNSILDLALKDDTKPYSYYGPAIERPRSNFNPYQDVLLGDIVLCWPSYNNPSQCG